MASVAIFSLPCRRERVDPEGGELHIPRLVFLLCSIWPIAQERIRVRVLIFPSLQRSNLSRRRRSAGARLGWSKGAQELSLS